MENARPPIPASDGPALTWHGYGADEAERHDRGEALGVQPILLEPGDPRLADRAFAEGYLHGALELAEVLHGAHVASPLAERIYASATPAEALRALRVVAHPAAVAEAVEAHLSRLYALSQLLRHAPGAAEVRDDLEEASRRASNVIGALRDLGEASIAGRGVARHAPDSLPEDYADVCAETLCQGCLSLWHPDHAGEGFSRVSEPFVGACDACGWAWLQDEAPKP